MQDCNSLYETINATFYPNSFISHSPSPRSDGSNIDPENRVGIKGVPGGGFISFNCMVGIHTARRYKGEREKSEYLKARRTASPTL